MKNKESIQQILIRLKEALLDPQCQILNRGFTGNNKEEIYLVDDIIKLRECGIDIKLPTSFCGGELGGMIYKELCAEVIRQIEYSLHPIKNWFVNHIDTLLSSVIGIGALIVSIISLCS